MASLRVSHAERPLIMAIKHSVSTRPAPTPGSSAGERRGAARRGAPARAHLRGGADGGLLQRDALDHDLVRLLLALREARLLARGRLLLLALQRLALRDRLALRLRAARLASPLVACSPDVMLLACLWCWVLQKLTQRALPLHPLSHPAPRAPEASRRPAQSGRARARRACKSAVCLMTGCSMHWRSAMETGAIHHILMTRSHESVLAALLSLTLNNGHTTALHAPNAL